MFRVLTYLLMLAFISGCVTEITVTPSRVEERVTRTGNIKLMCPTVDMAYDIADGDGVSPYCGYREVKGASPRSPYDSHLFGRGTIMQQGGQMWFWYEQGIIREYRRPLN